MPVGVHSKHVIMKTYEKYVNVKDLKGTLSLSKIHMKLTFWRRNICNKDIVKRLKKFICNTYLFSLNNLGNFQNTRFLFSQNKK